MKAPPTSAVSCFTNKNLFYALQTRHKQEGSTNVYNTPQSSKPSQTKYEVKNSRLEGKIQGREIRTKTRAKSASSLQKQYP